MTYTFTALTGSTTTNGHSARLLHAFLDGVREEAQHRHIEIDLKEWNVHDLHIPDLSLHNKIPNDIQGEDKDIEMIARRIEASDALIIGTPVWNFSIPAQLKQIIDRIGYIALGKKERKTIPLLHHLNFYALYTMGGPEIGWWGLMRWTCALGLHWTFRYYGAKNKGHMHASRCVGSRGVIGNSSFERRAKKKGKKFLRKVIKRPPHIVPTL